MTALAIKAALDAAAEAARVRMFARDTCVAEVCDVGPCACALDAATAAVAAFLRALPNVLSNDEVTHRQLYFAGQLASAVERAVLEAEAAHDPR